MTYSGHLEELVGIRWTIISGASIMSLGVILTSIAIQVRKKAILRTNEKKKMKMDIICLNFAQRWILITFNPVIRSAGYRRQLIFFILP